MVPDWFRQVVGSGLQRLYALSLYNAPGEIRLTAEVWAEALWAERVWIEERDAKRLTIAFQFLLTHEKRWPAPRHLMEALPAVPELVKLPPPPMTPEQRSKARDFIASLRASFKRP